MNTPIFPTAMLRLPMLTASFALWQCVTAVGGAQTPKAPLATPPPFGYIAPKATPAPASSPVNPANVPPQVKELNGVWAFDGYWGERIYVNGAFALKNGSDDVSKITVKLEGDGRLVLSITKLDFSIGDFVLTKEADGSYLGAVVPGTKDGSVEKIVLRRMDPPKEAPPLHAGTVGGKWTCVPAYGEKESVWEFRSGEVVSAQYIPDGSALKVKDGILRLLLDKEGSDAYFFYPVYLPGKGLGDRPKLVELRGIHVDRGARWRMTKLVRVAR